MEPWNVFDYTRKLRYNPFKTSTTTGRTRDWTQSRMFSERGRFKLAHVIKVLSNWTFRIILAKCIFKNLCNVPSHTEEQRRPHSSQILRPHSSQILRLAARFLLFSSTITAQSFGNFASLGSAANWVSMHVRFFSFYLNKILVANLSLKNSEEVFV